MTTTRIPAAPRTKRRNTAGNERLTAWVGATLFVLLAVEGLTILSVQSLLIPHVVVGMLIVGAVLLKIASTGYRFYRYYAGDPSYRRKGPPAPLLRVLGPLVILTTLAVLVTGILLLYVPRAQMGQVLQLHQASFLLWFVVMTVHVLAYIAKVPRLIVAEFSGKVPFGRRGRLIALGTALVLGALGALVALGPAHAWVATFLGNGAGH